MTTPNYPAGSWWPDFDAPEANELTSLGTAYQQAAPFPHIIIDNLFPSAALHAMSDEFDTAPPSIWCEFRGGLQRKRGTMPGAKLPPAVQDYFNLLYSGPFLRYLSGVTGINDLIPDPALHGGGMHEVAAGGSFEVHLDFVTHPRTRLTNRLAVITYLNEDWSAEDGGALELWEKEPPRCGTVVQPTFGRTIIMEQSALSVHGHPKPVREGRCRRSAIAYFYTNGLAENGNDVLATTYIRHDGYSRRQNAELYLRRFMPPFVIRGLKAITNAASSQRRRS